MTNEELIRDYLRYLEQVRDPESEPEDDAWERLDDLIHTNPRAAWDLIAEILERCADDDVAMIGAGFLENLLASQPRLAGDFEREIRSNDRFFRAFQYAGMTGVPLDVQRQLNTALLERGADPKFVTEYDEEVED